MAATGGGLGCQGGEKCELTGITYCIDGSSFFVDTCGHLTTLQEVCACGCNTAQTGCAACGCTPSCTNRECGSDGCGGSCGQCPIGESCDPRGACRAAQTSLLGDPCPFGAVNATSPDCDAGSGLVCLGVSEDPGSACGTDQDCVDQGFHEVHNPDCVAGAGCGASFCSQPCTPQGDCPVGYHGLTEASGQCFCFPDVTCTPDCAGRECGGDGCGGSCGTCGGSETCSAEGRCEGGTLSLQAQAVGAYTQIGSTCASGSVLNDYVAFLCPGGALNGGGILLDATELWCGTFSVSPAANPGCTDTLGCYPRVDATVKDTIIYGGQADVTYGYEFVMYLVSDGTTTVLYKRTQCNDQSYGYILMESIARDVTDNYCHSDACPQPGGATGGSGSCGTDCDCGHCWYCEGGTCRYGGEGPYGCYRGCD